MSWIKTYTGIFVNSDHIKEIYIFEGTGEVGFIITASLTSSEASNDLTYLNVYKNKKNAEKELRKLMNFITENQLLIIFGEDDDTTEKLQGEEA